MPRKSQDWRAIIGRHHTILNKDFKQQVEELPHPAGGWQFKYNNFSHQAIFLLLALSMAPSTDAKKRTVPFKKNNLKEREKLPAPSAIGEENISLLERQNTVAAMVKQPSLTASPISHEMYASMPLLQQETKDYRYLGEIAQENHQWKEAIANYTALISHFQKENKEYRATIYEKRAYCFVHLGKYKKAIKDLEIVYQITKKELHADTLHALRINQLEQLSMKFADRPLKLLKNYKALTLSLDPNKAWNRQVFYEYAFYISRAQKYHEAIENFEKVSKHFTPDSPADWEFFNNYAFTLASVGRHADAVAQYKKVEAYMDADDIQHKEFFKNYKKVLAMQAEEKVAKKSDPSSPEKNSQHYQEAGNNYSFILKFFVVVGIFLLGEIFYYNNKQKAVSNQMQEEAEEPDEKRAKEQRKTAEEKEEKRLKEEAKKKEREKYRSQLAERIRFQETIKNHKQEIAKIFSPFSKVSAIVNYDEIKQYSLQLDAKSETDILINVGLENSSKLKSNEFIHHMYELLTRLSYKPEQKETSLSINYENPDKLSHALNLSIEKYLLLLKERELQKQAKRVRKEFGPLFLLATQVYKEVKNNFSVCQQVLNEQKGGVAKTKDIQTTLIHFEQFQKGKSTDELDNFLPSIAGKEFDYKVAEECVTWIAEVKDHVKKLESAQILLNEVMLIKKAEEEIQEILRQEKEKKEALKKAEEAKAAKEREEAKAREQKKKEAEQAFLATISPKLKSSMFKPVRGNEDYPDSLDNADFQICLTLVFNSAENMKAIVAYKDSKETLDPWHNWKKYFALQGEIIQCTSALARCIKYFPGQTKEEEKLWNKLRSAVKHVPDNEFKQAFFVFAKQLGEKITTTFPPFPASSKNEKALSKDYLAKFSKALGFTKHPKFAENLFYKNILEQLDKMHYASEYIMTDEEYPQWVYEHVLPVIKAIATNFLKQASYDKAALNLGVLEASSLKMLLTRCVEPYTEPRQKTLTEKEVGEKFIQFVKLCRYKIYGNQGHETPEALDPNTLRIACKLASELSEKVATPETVNFAFQQQKSITQKTKKPNRYKGQVFSTVVPAAERVVCRSSAEPISYKKLF